MNRVVGQRDIVFITLDTLRCDVALECFRDGTTPHFAGLFPRGWEPRHTPGSFTYAAHHAFFAGFLPTPVRQPWPPRLFAARFEGSSSIGEKTFVYDTPDLVSGLAQRGYHTVCIGGVDFFSNQSALSSVLPGFFQESHWSQETGLFNPDSAQVQFELAAARLRQIPREQRVFLFINVSAIHQPNRHYVLGAMEDSLETHAAALRYVDSQLPRLLQAVDERGGAFVIVCSDHGTLYGEGENNLTGHRLAHPNVWTVPYAHTLREPA
jgi:hypothetical protein